MTLILGGYLLGFVVAGLLIARYNWLEVQEFGDYPGIVFFAALWPLLACVGLMYGLGWLLSKLGRIGK